MSEIQVPVKKVEDYKMNEIQQFREIHEPTKILAKPKLNKSIKYSLCYTGKMKKCVSLKWSLHNRAKSKSKPCQPSIKNTKLTKSDFITSIQV